MGFLQFSIWVWGSAWRPFSFAINKTVTKYKMILNEICDLTDWLIKIEKINKETCAEAAAI